MVKKDKDFYAQTIANIKGIYEWWGIDMTSMYKNIRKDFPKAYKALHKMYSDLRAPKFYDSKILTFEKVKYVYEAIANLLPNKEIIKHNLFTQELCKDYAYLNICSWKRSIEINQIDLLLAALLFTEEFILLPITSRNVILTDTKLTVYENFVTFKISKHKYKTYVSIKIRDVMLLNYVILN